MTDARSELIARAAARGRRAEAVQHFASRGDATETDRLRAELEAACATIAGQAAEIERLRVEIDRLNDELAALDVAPTRKD